MVWEFWLHWYNCYLSKWLEISFCSQQTDGACRMSLDREFQKEKQVCNGELQEIDDLNRGRRIVRESRRARHLIGFSGNHAWIKLLRWQGISSSLTTLNTKTGCAISRRSESVVRPAWAIRAPWHVPVLDHGFTPVITRLWRCSKWFMSWAEGPHQASWAYSSTGLTDVEYTDRIARAGSRFWMRWRRPIPCAALLQT